MEKWIGIKEVYYKGKNDVYRAYKGEELLWQKEYINIEECLVIQSFYGSTTFRYKTDGNKSPKFYVAKQDKYEVAQGITPTSFNTLDLNEYIYLGEEERLYIYGDNQESISDENNHFEIDRNYDGKVKIYGNLKALTNKEIPYLQYDYEFYGLFKNSDAIVDCSDLILPYGSKYMAFKELFYNCSYLKKAPIIPNVDMKNKMYQGMFYFCENLDEITCLTNSPSIDACRQWLSFAGQYAYNPTFYKKKGVEWYRGGDGIPSNFNIVEV